MKADPEWVNVIRMSLSEPQRESESTCVLSFSKCSLKTRVSRCSHPWVSLKLPLFVSRVVGQQLLVTPQTGDCTCVFVSTSQGYGKCLSGKRLLVLLLLLSHWWFMWSTAKQNGRTREEHLCHSFFFFPFSGSFLTGGYKLVCVWQGVDLHTQQELHVVTRTHQERAIKTTPCQLAVKTGEEELHELNKDWKLNSINIC